MDCVGCEQCKLHAKLKVGGIGTAIKILFDSKDDIYMKRYSCCQKCYYKFVDGREDRWQSGWRPSEERINGKS